MKEACYSELSITVCISKLCQISEDMFLRSSKLPFFFQKIMFCKLLDITNCKILLTYVHLAVILCILKAEDGQGRPKNVAYTVRFNKFVFWTAAYKLLLVCHSTTG